MAKQAYEGGCQCGAVRYKVDVDLDHTITCNCSRCGRLGSVLSFAGTDDFELISGEDRLTEYLFNSRQISHLFCSTCGIESFARGQKPDGTKMVAINARCLDDIEPEKLQPQAVDGRSR